MALNFWKKNNNVEDNKATAEDCIKIIEGNEEEKTEVKEKKFNAKKALKIGVGVAAGAGALAFALLGRKKANDGYTELGGSETETDNVESYSDESGTEA